MLNRSTTFQTCHQYIWSQTSVINIDVTEIWLVLYGYYKTILKVHHSLLQHSIIQRSICLFHRKMSKLKNIVTRIAFDQLLVKWVHHYLQWKQNALDQWHEHLHQLKANQMVSKQKHHRSILWSQHHIESTEIIYNQF